MLIQKYVSHILKENTTHIPIFLKKYTYKSIFFKLKKDWIAQLRGMVCEGDNG